MKWSNNEILILTNNYKKTEKELTTLLPNRNWSSIKQKAKTLGLIRPNIWKKEEEDFLKQYYSENGIKFCSQKLNRSEQSIKRKVDALKLKRNKNYRNIPRINKKHKLKDYTNQKFGLLTAKKFIHLDDKNRQVWEFECECGKFKNIIVSSVKSGNTKSCGCLKNKEIGKRCYKGGKYITGQEFGGYKVSAQRRNHHLDITIQDIERLYEQQNGKCKLSNIPIVFNTTIVSGNGKIINGNASIDRIDSTKGYTIDNIQLLDKDVNLAKQSLSQEGFIEMCCRIADYQRNLSKAGR